jgi:hypothetical protein
MAIQPRAKPMTLDGQEMDLTKRICSRLVIDKESNQDNLQSSVYQLVSP